MKTTSKEIFIILIIIIILISIIDFSSKLIVADAWECGGISNKKCSDSLKCVLFNYPNQNVLWEKGFCFPDNELVKNCDSKYGIGYVYYNNSRECRVHYY